MMITATVYMKEETPRMTVFDSTTTSVIISSSPSWACCTISGTDFIIENVVVKPAAYTAHVMNALLAPTVVTIGTIVMMCVHDPSVGKKASTDSVRIVPAEVNPPLFGFVVRYLFPYPPV
jgi:hypothetical protein